MAHVDEPCDWTVDLCDECCTGEVSGMPSGQAELLQGMAINFLWNATGRRYGLCERTYRPCRRSCGDFWGGLPTPWRVGGTWVNISCASCSSTCGCTEVSEVTIPNVQEIVNIRIDGIDMDPPSGTAVVYDHNRIVRVDGGLWPMCQNLSSTDGEGTWSLTVLQGQPIPDGGSLVAGILFCEMAKACIGSDGCRLPRRIQTITRQGVTAAFQDQFESLNQLRTGIWEVDAWIEANRRGVFRYPTITSPDVVFRPPELTWPL